MQKLVALFVVLLAPSFVLAATPSEGVPLQVRRGFFTETDVGGFFTLGGDDGYSNLQTYVQLGVGYQLTIGDGSALIPIGFHVGIGSNAQNCFAGRKATGDCAQADNFTMTFLSLTGGYLGRLAERVYLGGKLIAGYTLLDPAPIYTAETPPLPVNGGPNVGAALAFEYATQMDHFSVGIDIAFRLVIGPNIPSLAVYPRVQYTF